MDPKEKAVAEAYSFVGKLNDAILFPIIYLLGSVALLVFIYGGVQYIVNASSEQARSQGKQHIMYGLIGLIVMSSAYAILRLAAGTFGLEGAADCAVNPTGPGC